MKFLFKLILISIFAVSCSDDEIFEIIEIIEEANNQTTEDGIEIISEPTPEVMPEVLVTPTPEPTPEVLAQSNPDCDSLRFGDGRGGDLWLDSSEGGEAQFRGNPVYLLNNGFQAQPIRVEAELASGGLEIATFTGYANQDAGILRPHYRFLRDCTAYTGRLIISDETQVCEIVLPQSPCSRID